MTFSMIISFIIPMIRIPSITYILYRYTDDMIRYTFSVSLNKFHFISFRNYLTNKQFYYLFRFSFFLFSIHIEKVLFLINIERSIYISLVFSNGWFGFFLLYYTILFFKGFCSNYYIKKMYI